jgi:hypothetical protein
MKSNNESVKKMNDLNDGAMVTPTVARQCRTCRHRPKHWTRWQSAVRAWYDGQCRATGQITRPDNLREKWVGWTGEGDHGDGE